MYNQVSENQVLMFLVAKLGIFGFQLELSRSESNPVSLRSYIIKILNQYPRVSKRFVQVFFKKIFQEIQIKSKDFVSFFQKNGVIYPGLAKIQGSTCMIYGKYPQNFRLSC